MDKWIKCGIKLLFKSNHILGWMLVQAVVATRGMHVGVPVTSRRRRRLPPPSDRLWAGLDHNYLQCRYGKEIRELVIVVMDSEAGCKRFTWTSVVTLSAAATCYLNPLLTLSQPVITMAIKCAITDICPAIHGTEC